MGSHCPRTGPAGGGGRALPERPLPILNERESEVAKTTPGEFIRQVRAEGRKVVWPTRKETVTTAIMVLILTSVLALFFFGVDSAFSAIVRFLLGLVG